MLGCGAGRRDLDRESARCDDARGGGARGGGRRAAAARSDRGAWRSRSGSPPIRCACAPPTPWRSRGPASVSTDGPSRPASPVPNFRLTLEYDGAGFAGWQVQAGGVRTLQGELEAAIERVTRRTRARARRGPHGRRRARGRAGRERGARRPSSERPVLQRALNAVLPRDLAVVTAEIVADDFHARYHARAQALPLPDLERRRALRRCARARTWWVKPRARRRGHADRGGAAAGHARLRLVPGGGERRESRRRGRLTRCDVLRRSGAQRARCPRGDRDPGRGQRLPAPHGADPGRDARPGGQRVAASPARCRPCSPRATAARPGPTAPPQGLTLVRVIY